MANELMNPGPPDAPSGYGSGGAAAFYGLQQELLRRAALARQSQQDELDRQLKLQEIDASKENVASSKVSREAAAAANTERANKLGLEQATLGLAPGDAVSGDTKRAVLKFGGAGLIKSTPAMTEGVPSDFALAPDAAAAPEVAQTVASDTYKGTADQQTLGAHRDYAKKVVDALQAKKDNGGDLTPLEQEQLYEGNAILMTGKSATAPAGVIVPKAAPAQKLADQYNELKKKQLMKQPLTADETASIGAYEAQHPTDAQKQTDRIIIVDRQQAGADKRAVNSRLGTASNKLISDLNADEQKGKDTLERANRAMNVMSDTNFLSDVLQAPEVLQIVAGGQGSGLRMTTAELNNIMDAQTKMQALLGQARKATGLGEQTRFGTELRAQMQKVVAQVQAIAKKSALYRQQALTKLNQAEDTADINDIRNDYWQSRDETAGAGLPAGVTVTKRK